MALVTSEPWKAIATPFLPPSEVETAFVSSTQKRVVLNPNSDIVPSDGSGQSVLDFVMSGSGVTIPSRWRLGLTIVPVGTIDPNQQFDQIPAAIIQSIAINNGANNSEIWTCQDYNLWVNLLHKCYPVTKLEVEAPAQGYDVPEVVNGLDATPRRVSGSRMTTVNGCYVEIPINPLFWRGFLPLMGNHFLRFVLTMASSVRSLTNNGVSTTPSPSSWRIPAGKAFLIYDLVLTDMAKNDQIKQAIATGFLLPGLAYRPVASYTMAASNSVFQFNLSGVSWRSVQGIAMIPRLTSIVNSATEAALSTYQHLDVKALRLEIGGNTYPVGDFLRQVTLEGSAQLFDYVRAFTDLLMRHQDQSTFVSRQTMLPYNYDATKRPGSSTKSFFIYVPLTPVVGHGNGHDTITIPQQANIYLETAAALSASVELQIIVVFDHNTILAGAPVSASTAGVQV